MRLMRKALFGFLTILSIVSLVTAQDACPVEVDDALFALNDICLDIGRNQACYGNGEIEAIPQSGVTLDFDVPGDTALVDDIVSLSLSPFESSLDDWGVAVLVLQADLPDTLPGQNVTMLLFGDVSLSSDAGAYYFTSGIGTPNCSQAPNGLLIQTPDGAGEVNLTMNGVDITLGSTAYLGTLEEDILTFALIEGNATLGIEGSTVEVEGDQYTTIELDDEGNATGEFTEPEAIEDLDLPELPLLFLPESVEEADEEGNSSEGGSSSVSGDLIFPVNGTWTTTLGEMSFGEGCPSAIFNEDMMRQSLSEFGTSQTYVQDIDFEDVEDVEEFFRVEEFDQLGMSYSFSNPETNVYVMSFELPEGAGNFSYTWTVVSETRVEGVVHQQLIIPDLADCEITTNFIFENTD